MIVFNPSPDRLKVQIFGITYEVDANSELSQVPPEAAAYWKIKLHTFIELHDEAPKSAPSQPKEEKPAKETKPKATSTTKKK